MSKLYVKVKIISLADEARTIRRLENRVLDDQAYRRFMIENLEDPDLALQKIETAIQKLEQEKSPELKLLARFEIELLKMDVKMLQDLRKLPSETRKERANKYRKSLESFEPQYVGLRDHRRGIVRDEARSANIAYGFLRGRKYESIERPRPGNKPNWSRVVDIVIKYGDYGLGTKVITSDQIATVRNKLTKEVEAWCQTNVVGQAA